MQSLAEIDLDFMFDSAMEALLAADLREIDACWEVGAWKAVHVLAGSATEAVLIDALCADGSPREELLAKGMTLSKLIDRAENAELLTDPTVKAAKAVKEWRDLVHPGKVDREGQAVDDASGAMAVALLRLVLRDLADFGRGPDSAEAIAPRWVEDPSARSLVRTELAGRDSLVHRRLLVRTLPAHLEFEVARFAERYEDLPRDENGPIGDSEEQAKALAELFTLAFDVAPKDIKAQAVTKYAEVVTKRHDDFAQWCRRRLYRGEFLRHAAEDRDALVWDVVARLDDGLEVVGLGEWIRDEHATLIAEALGRIARDCRARPELIDAVLAELRVAGDETLARVLDELRRLLVVVREEAILGGGEHGFMRRFHEPSPADAAKLLSDIIERLQPAT